MLFYSVSISQLSLLVCETEAWEMPLFWLVSREECLAQMMKGTS